MKITILHPSYGRERLAYETAIKWVSNCVYPLQYIICVSVTDTLLSDYRKLFRKPFELVLYPEANMIKQMNYAATFAKNNLLIGLSDDFICPQNWDALLIDAVKDRADTDFIIKTKDGIQPFIMTLPIIGRDFYNRFNHIYDPAFFHFYGDEKLAEVGKILGKTITLDIEFKHLHYSVNGMKKDAVNIKNNAYFQRDKETFKIQKENNFYL